MRTREKFYENLNKRNIGKDKKFEFKNVKTLDGLSSKIGPLRSKVNSRMDEHEEAANRWTDAIDERKQWDEIIKEFPDEYPITMSASMKDQVDMFHFKADELEQKFEKEIKDNCKVK